MPINFVALKNEINNDPKSLGYAAFTEIGDDQSVANLLNAIGEGGDFQIDNEPVSPSKVVAVISQVDFDVLTPTALQKLQFLLSLSGGLDLADSSVLGLVSSVFPADGATRTALLLLSKRQGCRAEVLFGNGVRVSAADVAQALRNTP